jgi:hypothetical protein
MRLAEPRLILEDNPIMACEVYLLLIKCEKIIAERMKYVVLLSEKSKEIENEDTKVDILKRISEVLRYYEANERICEESRDVVMEDGLSCKESEDILQGGCLFEGSVEGRRKKVCFVKRWCRRRRA